MDSVRKIVSSESEELILVDTQDNETGHRSKSECHDGDGILHRAFSLFLFNGHRELLLQRRSESKRLWPGYWSNSCCSHPRRGESIHTATRRRLSDELNVTATLAIFTFMATQVGGMRENGVWGHWKGLVPPGVPWPLIPIMIPIEIMGMFTKPFALTVRLFANMIAGHIIILSFFNLIFAVGKMPYLAVLPFAGAVAISAFEIFIAFLQAFIFTFLSTIFIYQAVHPDH